MRTLISFLIIVLTGCTTLAGTKTVSKKESIAGIDDKGLYYRGSITKEANNVLFNTFQSSKVKPKRLVINSPGGEISLGMELGSWVYKNNLDVEVEGVCGSSCANYVFIAGNNKYLNKDSILIWHGSAWQKTIEIEGNLQDKLDEYLTIMRVKETKLYSLLNVDNLITIYGQEFFGFSEAIKHFLGKGAIGFDYSLEDMNKLGITNINLKNNEWDWRVYVPSKRNKVKRVSLPNDYQFKLNRFEI